MHWLSCGPLCDRIFHIFLYVSVASAPRVKLADRKIALTHTVLYSTDRSKAVVPMLILLFAALWFILRGDLFCLAWGRES